ncbi:MAG TPA: response regulator transcription factor, partial [Gemmatimonadaceae bacterium]|nr:response regulator transcription factor [Gemmatimonadaceae bacterium]
EVVSDGRRCDHKGMAGPTALVIDDEPQIRRAVSHALADDFAKVVEAANGVDGLRVAAVERPSLIVLDLGLPDMTGESACNELHQSSDAMILVLSARHADQEKATLLDAGADDYVTKPFSTVELKARVRALLRRASSRRANAGTVIRHGSLAMDLEARSLSSDGKPVHLTPTEWELVRVLMTNNGKTMTHRQLFAAVWPGRQYGDAQQYLRVHIANIRRKIEPNALDPRFIFTEPGVGYRFAAPQ